MKEEKREHWLFKCLEVALVREVGGRHLQPGRKVQQLWSPTSFRDESIEPQILRTVSFFCFIHQSLAGCSRNVMGLCSWDTAIMLMAKVD
jgi:hypothetical protein